MTKPKAYNHVLLSLTVGLVGMCGCGVVGSQCGPGLGTVCVPGTFCKLDDGDCETPEATGVCTAIPEACTLEFAPVCGCDGQTYGNECGADSAGVNVDHQGECDDIDARLCGGLQGLVCEEGEFCRFEEEALCGAADQTGICEVIPEACTEEFAPVCGCDDQTYGNDCFAAMAGVSIQAQGECP